MDSVVGKTTEGAITIIGGGKREFLFLKRPHTLLFKYKLRTTYFIHINTFLLGGFLATNELFGPIKTLYTYLQVTRLHVQPSGTPNIKSAMYQPVEEHLSNC